MPLIRIKAVQGHPVPKGYRSPRGPFPPELYGHSRAVDDDYQPDSLHESLDDIRMFKCRICEDVVYEDELSNHDCESE